MKNDFWIGDTVKLIDMDEVGTYEGLSPNGKIKVKVDQHILETKLENIEPFIGVLSKKKLKLQSNSNSLHEQASFSRTIDLHIEILAPKLVNSDPLLIREKQKRACSIFLKQCVEYKVSSAQIIHGKGSGVLKDIVLQEIQKLDNVLSTHSSNNGGATEVIFHPNK